MHKCRYMFQRVWGRYYVLLFETFQFPAINDSSTTRSLPACLPACLPVCLFVCLYNYYQIVGGVIGYFG